MIENKQNELNNIINNQTRPEINMQMQMQSQTQKQIIYNVDSKKTKKNFNNININKNNDNDNDNNNNYKKVDVIDVVKNKNNNNNSNSSNNSKLTKIDTQKANETITEKENNKIIKKTIINNTILDIKDSNEPYKYYIKKDFPNLKWPSKSELYNSETFTDNLSISLSIQPIFTNKNILKDKNTLEEIKQILLNTYNFKHINNFKDNLVNYIYKILHYDKINIIL